MNGTGSISCRCDRYGVKWITMIVLLLFPLICFSQQPDSVSAGVIKVKHDSVRAYYIVVPQYDFARNAGTGAWWLDPYNVLQPPSPDTLHALLQTPSPHLQDTLDAMKSNLREAVYAGAFNWSALMNKHCSFRFAFSDSAKLDSARIEIDVDPDGTMTARAVPWPSPSALSSRLSDASLEMFNTLWLWYPGSVRNKGELPMFVPCTVELKIYAFDIHLLQKIQAQQDAAGNSK